ncbi:MULTISPECIES: UdgX family uracil-DNA binding protein [Roseomonadaceae]|uniref:UdgX family uracil-DNA binding protein n=1 Tax=Falsiroseomonas oleicola TaxID=2801474 RepID=A0ABS6H7B3_9PROT|nr:UdgX family uracil-DNA binding protein [Roseomonas oleicola]MBU8543371.1 UdgX family uracil-DNA binding protein [Roseomonas oleicola]
MRCLAVTLPGPADFLAWRQAARGLVAADIPPEQAEWVVAGDMPGLLAEAPAPPPSAAPFSVPRAFLDQAEIAIRHSDPERFALLYGLLWRITRGERHVMQAATDPAVIRLGALAKAVRRDAHKMHAFVRFREVQAEDGARHIAWFEPDHHIEEAEAGFFVRRFASLRWSIVTPRRSVAWDGAALSFGPGGRRADVPPDDATEPLWRTYYGAIFNPARLKPGAMRAEMPRKYWRNLPEAAEIPRLLAEAPGRVAAMAALLAPNPRPQRQVHLSAPARVAPDMRTPIEPPTDPAMALAALREELLARPDLPAFSARATQPVFGEGPVGAALMFVGEQPGDEEDIAGRPFVGPAGRLLDRALAQAGVARSEAYLTNAVKHFKFTATGKRRLHQSPDAGDITYYRPFLAREVTAVAPRLVVALGATALAALAALTGRKLPVLKTRGQVVTGLTRHPVFATIHPSYLLRLPDEGAQQAGFVDFVADLRAAAAQAAA